MIRSLKSLLLLCCFHVMLAAIPASADIKSDFLSSNPNAGGWTVGYLDKDSNFVAYNSTFDDGNGIAGWTMDRTPGPRGDVTINYTDQPIDRYGVHWEPGETLVHSPLIGGGVVVKWNASSSEAASVDMSVTHTSGAKASIELWSEGNKLYDGMVSEATGQNAIKSASNHNHTSDLLEKSFSLTSNDGNEVKFLVLPLKGKIASCHLGVFLKVNVKSADVSSSVSTKFGRHLPALQAKSFDVRMASKAGSDAEVSVK